MVTPASGGAVSTIDLDGYDWERPIPQLDLDEVVVGVASAPLPKEAAPLLERLTITIAPGGPGREWVNDPESLSAIEAACRSTPLAVGVLLDVLRVTSKLNVADGVVVESLGFSTLLDGPEFTSWRRETPRRIRQLSDHPILLSRCESTLAVTLNRPERHNAYDRAMRDALCDALSIAEHDSSLTDVVLTGSGPSFCSGGDLDEFGTTPDAATARWIRLDRNAGLAIHRLRNRVRPILHGACIGAGIEIPAFASNVAAKKGTYFCLPELGFGLVPGAGGTVSVTRRIGRHRMAWLALTGAHIDLDTALAWGLVDHAQDG